MPKLFDAVGSGLAPHSPKRAIWVSTNDPTFGLYPPFPPHSEFSSLKNKNNSVSEAVFWFTSTSVAPLIDTRILSITNSQSASIGYSFAIPSPETSPSEVASATVSPERERMSILYPVSLAARRTFCPPLPMARES